MKNNVHTCNNSSTLPYSRNQHIKNHIDFNIYIFKLVPLYQFLIWQIIWSLTKQNKIMSSPFLHLKQFNFCFKYHINATLSLSLSLSPQAPHIPLLPFLSGDNYLVYLPLLLIITLLHKHNVFFLVYSSTLLQSSPN